MARLDWSRARSFRATESVRGDLRPPRNPIERRADWEMRRWAGQTGLHLDMLDASPPKAKPARRKPPKRKSRPAGERVDAIPDEAKPLIDRYGNRYGERILTAWSDMAREALGVRRVDAGGDA